MPVTSGRPPADMMLTNVRRGFRGLHHTQDMKLLAALTKNHSYDHRDERNQP
jgi:hypothetical protein